MESRIAQAIRMSHQPVAVMFTNKRPRGAAQFKEKRWGCVMSMLSFASRGYTAVFDRQTTPCAGGQAGLCFGDGYEKGRDVARLLSGGRGDGVNEGLGFLKTPALAKRFMANLPTQEIPETYVVFKALNKVDGRRDRPRLIIFLANADQVSALTVLANYDRPGGDAVKVPFASGCQAVCLLPFVESQADDQHAILGGMDISARPHLDPDVLTFSVPYAMYKRMEKNVKGSFLQKETWRELSERIG
jgi:uncharacterized protein (DUF169 family)